MIDQWVSRFEDAMKRGASITDIEKAAWINGFSPEAIAYIIAQLKKRMSNNDVFDRLDGLRKSDDKTKPVSVQGEDSQLKIGKTESGVSLGQKYSSDSQESTQPKKSLTEKVATIDESLAQLKSTPKREVIIKKKGNIMQIVLPPAFICILMAGLAFILLNGV